MRGTVLVFDLLIYVPALFMFVRTWLGSRSRRTQVFLFHTHSTHANTKSWCKNLAFLTLLLQPALLLIDYGHFQYNSVMLGSPSLLMHYLGDCVLI